MNRKTNWNRNAQFVVVLLCALALKLFYSTASANELRWILAPTTAVVELVTGTRFEFESYAGYINSDRSFIIAGACAGVNFLITAFLMLSLRMLWRDRLRERSDNLERPHNLERSEGLERSEDVGPSGNLAWSFILIVLLFSYFATIVTNTIRISIALWLRQTSVEISWLSPAQLHRFEGILVYFGMLLLLFVISERLQRNSDPDKSGGGLRGGSRSGLLRPALFPLLLYYLTALGIPLANSVLRGRVVIADFWEHSVFVLLIPLPLIAVLAAFRIHHVADLKSRRPLALPNLPANEPRSAVTQRWR